MTPTRAPIVMVLPLLMAASDKGGSFSAGDYAEGSLALLVSKRCESSPKLDMRTIEWPGLVYGPGRPPAWGHKTAGACRGLDTWVLSEALAAGAYWVSNDHAAIEAEPNTTMFDDPKTNAAFKKLFGWELPERGDDVPPRNVFLKFDPKKVSALFDKIYVKPTDKVGSATGQDVYDVFFKDAVARFAREVALINAAIPKPALTKQLKAYQAAAKQQAGKFSGPAYLKEAAAGALPKDDENAARAGRTLGVMLRRTADSTWPIISKLLKKVVTDYDPPLAQELGKKL
jgi:hypothetical protein